MRKACADVFTDVSEACNLSTRYNQLTPAFLKLLHDDSRWVKWPGTVSLQLLLLFWDIIVVSICCSEFEMVKCI